MKLFAGNELIFRFMFINISSGTAVGMMNFIIPVYALSLNASSTEIGLIRGISGVGDLLVVLPAGFLVDYFGSKKMYSVSCILGATTIMLLPLTGTPQLLLLMMVFYGMARTIRTTSLSAAFFNDMNAIGPKKAGWYKGSMTIGASFIGPAIGGIAAIVLGFSSYFAITSAFLLVPLTIVYSRTSQKEKSQISLKNSSLSGASSQYKNLAKNVVLVRATIIESMNTAFFMTFTTFITVMVIRDMGLSAGTAAFLISAKGMATILVVFFGSALLRINNNRVYLLAFLLTIFSLLILGISKDINHLGIASVILGIGSGMITLITFTQVGNIDGEKGKIAGVFSFGHGIGAIFGPTAGGLIGDAFGVQAIFLAFMVLFGVLAVYIVIISNWRIQRSLRRGRDSNPR